MKKWGLILSSVLAGLIILAIILSLYYAEFSLLDRSLSVSFAPAATPVKRITIVALGDSLTQAANPSNELVGDHPEYSYSCGSKIESLDKLKEKEGFRVNCYNLSKSGARSEQVLAEQVPEAKNHHPDLVVMTIGGNDAMQGVNSADLKNNLVKIIESFPDTKILIGNIPNLEEFRKNDYPACLTPLSQYRELESLTAVYILDYNLVFESLESSNVKIIDLFNNLGKEDVSSYDCLHFSVLGQGKTAQLFFGKL